MIPPQTSEIIENLHQAVNNFIGAFDVGQLRFHYLDGDDKGQLDRLEEFKEELDHARHWRNWAEDWMQSQDQPGEDSVTVVNNERPPATWNIADHTMVCRARDYAIATLREAQKILASNSSACSASSELDQRLQDVLIVLEETTKR